MPTAAAPLGLRPMDGLERAEMGRSTSIAVVCQPHEIVLLSRSPLDCREGVKHPLDTYLYLGKWLVYMSRP